MIPGLSPQMLNETSVDERTMAHVEAIILSMTPKERANPDVLNSSRKKRIAAGSGRTIQEINRLLKQFEQMKSMMKQFTDMQRGQKGKKGKSGLQKLGLPFMQ
jgi:signal recognition particle subunit SRP54